VLLPHTSQGTARQREAEALAYDFGMALQPMPVWVYFGRAAHPYDTLRLVWCMLNAKYASRSLKWIRPRGTTNDDTRGDFPRDPSIRLRSFKMPLRNLVNGVVLPSVTNIGHLEEE
jgi:hypothetical protein